MGLAIQVTEAVCWIRIDLGRGGGAKVRGDLRLGPWTGDGWVEAEWYFFIYLPHLALSAILDVTYSIDGCTAPK